VTPEKGGIAVKLLLQKLVDLVIDSHSANSARIESNSLCTKSKASGPTALESLKKQLHLQVKFFRGKHGKLIRSLVAEAQSNEDLEKAFRQRWLTPRRAGVGAVLRKAIEQGEFPPIVI